MRINAFEPGYIVPGKDVIVGLRQRNRLREVFVRSGGIKMVREEVAEFGEKLPKKSNKMFELYNYS